MKKSGYSHSVLPATIRHGNGLHAASYVSRGRKMTIATIHLTQTQASIQAVFSAWDEGQAAFAGPSPSLGMSPTRYRRDGQREQYAISLAGGDGDRAERRSAAAAAARSANGFRRHDATSADIMANPVILAQGGDLNITTCARRPNEFSVADVDADMVGSAPCPRCGRRLNRRSAVHHDPPTRIAQWYAFRWPYAM